MIPYLHSVQRFRKIHLQISCYPVQFRGRDMKAPVLCLLNKRNAFQLCGIDVTTNNGTYASEARWWGFSSWQRGGLEYSCQDSAALQLHAKLGQFQELPIIIISKGWVFIQLKIAY